MGTATRAERWGCHVPRVSFVGVTATRWWSRGPTFVVTGTGRSGTRYVSELFRAAGVRCGHEDWFGPVPGLRDVQTIPRAGPRKLHGAVSRVREEWRRRRQILDGDASWLAVPRLPTFGGTVLLQLRHPVPVIRSFVGMSFFSDPERSGSVFFHRFARAHFPITGDDVVDAMRWWIEWNRRAERYADRTYRLEDLDVARFARLLTDVGVTTDVVQRARRAFATAPADRNAAEDLGFQRASLGWADLPSGPLKQELAAAACRFGYVPEASDGS